MKCYVDLRELIPFAAHATIIPRENHKFCTCILQVAGPAGHLLRISTRARRCGEKNTCLSCSVCQAAASRTRAAVSEVGARTDFASRSRASAELLRSPRAARSRTRRTTEEGKPPEPTLSPRSTSPRAEEERAEKHSPAVSSLQPAPRRTRRGSRSGSRARHRPRRPTRTARAPRSVRGARRPRRSGTAGACGARLPRRGRRQALRARVQVAARTRSRRRPRARRC